MSKFGTVKFKRIKLSVSEIDSVKYNRPYYTIYMTTNRFYHLHSKDLKSGWNHLENFIK